MTTAMTTGTTPGQPGTITASAIAAIETVVRERQNLVDEWRMRSDNSLPPRECVFTAYNITKEVQSKHQQWAPHAQVRDIVHDTISRIMSMDECLIDIPGVTTKPGVERPRLYHPPEISHQVAEQIFSNYGHVNVNVQFVPSNVLGDGGAKSQLSLPGPSGSIAVVTPAAQASITATPGTGGKQQDGTYTVDKRGRLWIPADMLRAIQAAPGTSVYVTIDGSNLVITTSVPTGATQAAMYKVDPSNNIAVSKSAFDEAGMTSGKFNIAGHLAAQQIRITAA
jgi:antitoxin component of MazEF toxin-antitoxin module